MKRLAPFKNGQFAYASLLCDDVMIEAVKVLIHSLKQTGTPHPFLLLILPGVTQTDDLVKLGAELHRITPLDYPFKVSAEKAAINKMCRYSKLHIWRFTRYQKIVFVDVDTLITQNIDAAFRWPEFSAVRDAGDTFNTGLFVLQPSMKTYKKMVDSYFNAPSYNQGDQGFINWYFRDSPKHALPVRYNTMCKHKSFAVWPQLQQQARMLHFTSETKPWSFFSSSHRFWRQNYEPRMFLQWASTYINVSKTLQIDAHDPHRGHWYNADRTSEVCRGAIDDHLLGVQVAAAKMTVVIVRWRNINSLETALFHYRRIVNSVVDRIVISWNPSLGTPPSVLAKYKNVRDPAVDIILHRYESVGNVFQPISNLTSKAVFLVDDEHFPDLERMEIALETWNNNPFALVGFFAKYHGKQKIVEFDSDNSTIPYSSISPFDQKYQWIFNLTSIKRPRPYSLISAPLMLLNTEYLFAYTCLLPERIHRFLDEQDEDGADMAMNLLVSGMSGNRPVVVRSDLPDPEQSRFTGGEGTQYAHSKGRLLQELAKLFALSPATRDSLQFNNVVVAQFNKIPFRKRSIKRWND